MAELYFPKWLKHFLLRTTFVGVSVWQRTDGIKCNPARALCIHVCARQASSRGL